MTGFATNRHTTVTLQNCFGIPSQTGVIHNFCTGFFQQEYFCQQANNVVAFNELCIFVKEEATVKVTVPSNTQICTSFTNYFSSSFAVRHQNRIGYAIGEASVRLVKNGNKFKRQMFCQFFHNRACTAVTGVSHNFHRFQCRFIYIAQQMFNISRNDIYLLQFAQSFTGNLCVHKIGSHSHFANFF